tara:strand:- start:148 stop:372 length:225 start_codon:yes stop_codon:yes gene_type:complete
MTRENLKSFINAAEHRLEIRKELHKTKELNEIIEIASRYGFKISARDIQEATSLDQLEDWFNQSKIYPFQNSLN